MYRLNDIVSSFSTLVGWKDTELSESRSGLYFQEAHPMLTLRALRGIMPKDLAEKYPPYDENATYSKDEKVRSGGKVYVSIRDDNSSPVTSVDWREYDVLNDYLRYITERGIKKVITKFANEKVAGMETKNLVDRRTVFDGAGSKEAKVQNRGRLVGFELTPFRSNGITTILNKVGVQFIGNTGDVKLYLFHSSQPEPIATKTVSITSDKGVFTWVDLDWTLPYLSDDINAGGAWYVVYHEANLPDYMESINFGRDWSREPCGTCNKGSAQLYRLMQKYITLAPFYAVENDWDEKLWDIEDNIYTPCNNYGMNFMFTMSCDITDTIITEAFQFASTIQLQVATDALRELALNPEVAVNRVQSNAERDNIMFEAYGNGEGIKGLQGELTLAYKALSVDLKGLDPICMGCHNKGVRYTSI